jgi:hypothetical protein
VSYISPTTGSLLAQVIKRQTKAGDTLTLTPTFFFILAYPAMRKLCVGAILEIDAIVQLITQTHWPR